jgi:hypothetical protein
MSNNINLGSIDYEQIKDSLTEFLKKQDVLKDYNFEGSVLQSLVSLLSYNTLYYAFYSNMLSNEMFLDSAQREQSIISLVKPLGITVPSRTSARAKVRTGGLEILPQFSQFSGKNESGIIYNFYALENYSEDNDNFINNIVLVEGKQLIQHRSIKSLIDYTNQTYFIPDNTIDISTLIVEVDEGDGVYKKWILSDNIGDSTENLSQNIYFIERYETGFEIQFGKENSLGNEILDTYNTRISYLISSGSAANNVVNFEYVPDTNVIVELIEQANGGLNGPDLDYLKFIAPKFFAAQNRAITKDDFLALSTVYLRNKGYDVTKDNFSIFGGDQLFPPQYGRVFIATDVIPRTDILDLVAHLKTKCALTILPEYVDSNQDTIFFDLDIKFKNTVLENDKQFIISNIKNYITNTYIILNKYNINFNGQTIQDDILNRFTEINTVNLKLYYDSIKTGGEINVNLENELDFNVGENKNVCEQFTDTNGRVINLRANITSNQDLSRLINLRTSVLTNGTPILNSSLLYGKINVKEGILQISDIYSGSINITLPIKNKFFNTTTNTKFSILLNNIIEL